MKVALHCKEENCGHTHAIAGGTLAVTKALEDLRGERGGFYCIKCESPMLVVTIDGREADDLPDPCVLGSSRKDEPQ